ncbi:hypothetical protein KUTeg_002397 [Tegillarca granosa]|uniref:Trafficking protein particle complex subunit n=1 Tax=Tegillarca granosa TaxID=220873 RepID=A0ABQ9FUB3_TEGGR|nr:hypothetical protein KUTeg_002397 [Tegillarca granosa]
MFLFVVGHTVLSVNGVPVEGRFLQTDGRDVMEMLAMEENFPLDIKFGRPKLTTNEKIMLASMFHSSLISGLKFLVMADSRQTGVDILLKKLYEIYSDFALKNPFYSLDMPIRCDLFDTNLQQAMEQSERSGLSNV